jgi:aldehyde dehydrogenase (NAD+)
MRASNDAPLRRAVLTTTAAVESSARPAAPQPPLRPQYGLFVGNDWVAAESQETLDVVNPASEAVLTRVAVAGAADVDRAVRAARRGYDKYWRKLSGADRAKYVYRLAEAVTERLRDLALVETADAGRPLVQTRSGDVPAAAASLFYHAGWADKLEWALRPGQRARPYGVVAALGSWAAPLLETVEKVAPAVACGNTVVVKPHESTPLAALLLADIALEAGLPAGVINVVTGGDPAAEALAEHAGIDRLAFSGATDGGKTLRRRAAGAEKATTLELAGKPAAIVLDDADIKRAARAVVRSALAGRGAAAGGGCRLLAHASVAARVVEAVQHAANELRVGDPLDAATDIGPLASRAARDRFVDYVRGGVEEGATLLPLDHAAPTVGFFATPAVFAGVEPSYRISREEAFGPTLAITTFASAREAVERANALPGGRSVSLWSADAARALEIAARLTATTVWWNESGPTAPSAPRDGSGGVAGLLTYVQT